jgi:hypothetical protein
MDGIERHLLLGGRDMIAMKWKEYDEAVEMIDLRYRFLPRLFRWRGQVHNVEWVERNWTQSQRRAKQRAERRFFRVRCASTALELYQDLRSGTWHVHRARLLPAHAPMIRQAAPAWR